MELDDLFTEDKFTHQAVIMFCGLAITRDQKEAANRRGILILERFGVVPTRVPTRDTQKLCPTCCIVLGTTSEKNAGLGWRYLCRQCRVKISPNVNTLLYNVRLREVGANIIILLGIHFVNEVPPSRAKRYCKLTHGTVTIWYHRFRDAMRRIANHEVGLVGDTHDIVELGETHLHGSPNINRKDRWVVGGISRSTSTVFGCVVPDRTGPSIMRVLRDKIHCGSVICSKQWHGYNECRNVFAGHGKVRRTVELMDRLDQEPPRWAPAERFNPECLDTVWDGPPPVEGTVPYRYHMENLELIWRGFKR